jgi:hypothetical protein
MRPTLTLIALILVLPLLTGEKLTAAQMADLETKKKARDARCKPQTDHLADIQRQILAAQRRTSP